MTNRWVNTTSEKFLIELFNRHGTGPAEAVMAGNSMKSDVLPALAAGAYGVHIPYHVTWAHELADAPQKIPFDDHSPHAA